MSERPKYSTDPKLNAALEADARKLGDLGADFGITLDDPVLTPPAPGVTLDFEAKLRKALHVHWPLCEIGCDTCAEYRALERQAARLVAEAVQREREKYEAYPRRPLPEGMTPEEELEYWRSETLALDTWHDIQNKRVADHAALVERVREFQQSRQAWLDSRGLYDTLESDRYEKAKDALAAHPLPEPQESTDA